MIKKSEYFFWKKRNKKKIGKRIYFDDTHIKRTKMTLFGIPFYIKDEVLKIVSKDQYQI